jgi:hypothetical protein
LTWNISPTTASISRRFYDGTGRYCWLTCDDPAGDLPTCQYFAVDLLGGTGTTLLVDPADDLPSLTLPVALPTAL